MGKKNLKFLVRNRSGKIVYRGLTLDQANYLAAHVAGFVEVES